MCVFYHRQNRHIRAEDFYQLEGRRCAFVLALSNFSHFPTPSQPIGLDSFLLGLLRKNRKINNKRRRKEKTTHITYIISASAQLFLLSVRRT